MNDSQQTETVGGMMGRIVTGVALMVLGAGFAAGCVVLFVRGVLNPDISDWMDLLGDVIGSPRSSGSPLRRPVSSSCAADAARGTR